MKVMKIFEPSMCCPTGLCGVSVDPELLRISTVLETLKKNGIEVGRYNLSSAPQAFIEEEAVQKFIKHFSPNKLPVTTIDGFIIIAGRYPTNEEFTSWLDIELNVILTHGVENVNEGNSDCCCGNGTYC